MEWFRVTGSLLGLRVHAEDQEQTGEKLLRVGVILEMLPRKYFAKIVQQGCVFVLSPEDASKLLHVYLYKSSVIVHFEAFTTM